MSTILVTGGCGFIGSHLLQEILRKEPETRIVNIDSKTYAARPPLYLHRPKRLIEEAVDIRDQLAVHRVMSKYKPQRCIHMAAESHVCRSITGPKDFITTNVVGTFNVLEEFLACGGLRFVHVSTDEVFGEIRTGHFAEDSPMIPRNPYAASKASSDLIVKAYRETYKAPVITLNMANNFGPNQHPEKLVPRTIRRIISGQPVIVHGDGLNSREWLFVSDAVRGIYMAMMNGVDGQRYCLKGERELKNIEMVNLLHNTINRVMPGGGYSLEIQHTNDRPTDDCRYAMNSDKAWFDFEWQPAKGETFQAKIDSTVIWYTQRAMMQRGGRRSTAGA